jgi:hypothetical protein
MLYKERIIGGKLKRRNPRQKRRETLSRIESAQRKAVRAALDLRDDPDLADELESLTPEEYAERRGWEIAEENPARESTALRKAHRQIARLQAELEAMKAERKAALDAFNIELIED